VLQKAVLFLVLTHVDVTSGVSPDGVASAHRRRTRGTSPSRQKVTVEGEDGNERVEFGDVDESLVIHIDVTGTEQTIPLGDEFARGREHLNAVVLAIGDDDPT